MAGGVFPHGLKASAFAVLGALFVRVFRDNNPALLLSEFPKLQELIERILTFVVG
jgi:hypothetical protein